MVQGLKVGVIFIILTLTLGTLSSHYIVLHHSLSSYFSNILGPVEYTDCIYEEGVRPLPQNVLDTTLNIDDSLRNVE